MTATENRGNRHPPTHEPLPTELTERGTKDDRSDGRVPPQPQRQGTWSEEEVQDPPAVRHDGFGRGVKQQRAHQQGPTPGNRHRLLAARIADLGLGLGIQAPQSMRAGHDAQRPVFGRAGIDMDPDRDEAFKNRDRRLYEEHALLDRPAAAFRILNTLPDRDAQILVQRHEPVGLRRLGERCALNRNEVGGYMPRYIRIRSQHQREISAPGQLKKCSGPCLIGGEGIKIPRDLRALDIGQDSPYDHEPVRFKGRNGHCYLGVAGDAKEITR